MVPYPTRAHTPLLSNRAFGHMAAHEVCPNLVCSERDYCAFITFLPLGDWRGSSKIRGAKCDLTWVCEETTQTLLSILSSGRTVQVSQSLNNISAFRLQLSARVANFLFLFSVLHDEIFAYVSLPHIVARLQEVVNTARKEMNCWGKQGEAGALCSQCFYFWLPSQGCVCVCALG